MNFRGSSSTLPTSRQTSSSSTSSIRGLPFPNSPEDEGQGDPGPVLDRRDPHGHAQGRQRRGHRPRHRRVPGDPGAMRPARRAVPPGYLTYNTAMPGPSSARSRPSRSSIPRRSTITASTPIPAARSAASTATRRCSCGGTAATASRGGSSSTSRSTRPPCWPSRSSRRGGGRSGSPRFAIPTSRSKNDTR